MTRLAHTTEILPYLNDPGISPKSGFHELSKGLV